MAEDQLSLFAESASPIEAPVADPPPPLPPALAQDVEHLLAQASAACDSCFRCRLGETRTRAVYGSGNPRAAIMLIGEGPGAQEDATGLPFVGAAGQLLTKVLGSVGLDRERDTYIGNVVKCRPPGNRAPAPDEMDLCRVYLDEQIALVNPRIILLLGATALKGVLDRTGITKLRGQWFEADGRWYMPIFHPSYLLRNASRDVGSPKWLTWQDMQRVREKLDGLRAAGRVP